MIDVFLKFGKNLLRHRTGKDSSKISEVLENQRKSFIYKKAVRQAEKIQKDTKILTHRQKQMQDYYAAVSKQVDQYDMLNSKKLKFYTDTLLNGHNQYFKKHGTDAYAQNLVNDKIVSSFLIPQGEVSEERTTIPPMKISSS